MKHLSIIGSFLFFTCTVQSENKCENNFSKLSPPSEEATEEFMQTNSEYDKNFHFKDNPVSPRKVRRIARKYDTNKISKINIDYPEPISNITQTENMRLSIGEIDGQKVFIEEITPMNLQKLTVLRALKEIGVPTLFLGTGKTPENTPYLIYDFMEGSDVPLILLMPKKWKADMKSTRTLQQIADIGEFFILKGIYTDNLEIFISKDGNIFINHPQNYIFKGRHLSKKLKGEIEFYFKKMIKNIEINSSYAIENALKKFNSDQQSEGEPPVLKNPLVSEDSPNLRPEENPSVLKASLLDPKDITVLEEIFETIFSNQNNLSLNQKLQIIRILQLESTLTNLLQSSKQSDSVIPFPLQKETPPTEKNSSLNSLYPPKIAVSQ